jgi:hypothetical protein
MGQPPQDKIYVVVAKQTYQLLLAIARLNKKPLSLVAGETLDQYALPAYEREARLRKALTAIKFKSELKRWHMTEPQEPYIDTVEDGVVTQEDTTIQEALDRWNVLNETETE